MGSPEAQMNRLEPEKKTSIDYDKGFLSALLRQKNKLRKELEDIEQEISYVEASINLR